MEDEHIEIVEDPTAEPRSSVIVTLLVFMAAIALVRFVMPPLVEEVHYAIELGRQRAAFEFATERLEDDPLVGLSEASRLVNQKISPSVVHIDTTREASPGEIAEDAALSAGPLDDIVHGQGSGVIISDKGEIITNYHVIEYAEKITVTLNDDQELEAQVVGVDRLSDLALLRVEDASNLVPAVWGDSDAAQEGSMVWALGSPFGLSKTITFGILSGKARKSFDRGNYHEFLQSDAAVSAGNSGGPLVDSMGRVIGINTAIIGPVYQGVSFAIPSKRVRGIYDKILSQERQSEQAWLGVRLSPPPPGSKTGGALIEQVVNTYRSPAKAAGIKPGDFITVWNGVEVTSPAQLRRLVAESAIDEPVDIRVIRGDEANDLVVRIGPKPLQF